MIQDNYRISDQEIALYKSFGFIVSVLLLVVGLVGKYFHSEVLDEASYRDDHNPHITEWKEKLRERK